MDSETGGGAYQHLARKRSRDLAKETLEFPASVFALGSILESDEEDKDMKDGWKSADVEARRYWAKKRARYSAMGAIEFPRGMYSMDIIDGCDAPEEEKKDESGADVKPLFKLQVLEKSEPKKIPARPSKWVKVGTQWVKEEPAKLQEELEESLEDYGTEEGSVAASYISSPTRTAKITARWKNPRRRSLSSRSNRRMKNCSF